MGTVFKNQLVTIGFGLNAYTVDASTVLGQLALIRDGVINIHKIDGPIFEEVQIEYSRRRFAIDASIWQEVPDMFSIDILRNYSSDLSSIVRFRSTNHIQSGTGYLAEFKRVVPVCAADGICGILDEAGINYVLAHSANSGTFRITMMTASVTQKDVKRFVIHA